MSNDEKTPLEIAREVWPGLDWASAQRRDGSWWVWADLPFGRVSCEGGGTNDKGNPHGWAVEFCYAARGPWLSADLRAALTEARDQIAQCLRESLALCESPPDATTQALQSIADRLRAGEEVIIDGERLGPPPLPDVARQVLDRPPGHVDPVPHHATPPEAPLDALLDVLVTAHAYLKTPTQDMILIGEVENALIEQVERARVALGHDRHPTPTMARELTAIDWSDMPSESWLLVDTGRGMAWARVRELRVVENTLEPPVDDARAATPEPPPEAGEGDVWAEIIERLEPGPLRDACIVRRQMGVEKYGQPLQRGDGRNHAVDEAQEHLDAAAYRAARAGADDPEVMASLRRAGECLGIVEPYPARVVRHAGEAVLLLTDQDGDAWPILSGQILAVREYDAGGALIRTDEPALGQVLVREPAADILRTLEMLRAEQGGAE